MAEPLPSMDSLFMETVKGRYPLAEGPSTAKFWTPFQDTVDVIKLDTSTDPPTTRTITKKVDGKYVPRPDRSMVVLQALAIFGFLGIDHFYLRSTKTGIIKLLTLGGLGIWWLWDMLQIFTEKERVLNYGLTTPFDANIGIGQGMLTDRSTEYSQNTSWFLWSLSTIFGFAGTTYFMLGRTYLAMRFLLIVALASAPVSVFIAQTMSGGFGSAAAQAGFFGFLTTIFWMMLLLFGVGPVWLQHMMTALFNPGAVMTEGLPTPSVSIDAFRYWHRFYMDKENKVVPESETEFNLIREHWDPTPEGITADELKKRFWIGYHELVSVDKQRGNVSFIPALLVVKVFSIMWEKIKKAVSSAFNAIKGAVAGGAATAMLGPLGGPAMDLMGSLAAKGDSSAPAAAAAAGPLAAAAGPLAAAAGPLASVAGPLAKAAAAAVQSGGGRSSGQPLSTEAKITGAVLIALISGGALKGLIDSTVRK